MRKWRRDEGGSRGREGREGGRGTRERERVLTDADCVQVKEVGQFFALLHTFLSALIDPHTGVSMLESTVQ